MLKWFALKWLVSIEQLREVFPELAAKVCGITLFLFLSWPTVLSGSPLKPNLIFIGAPAAKLCHPCTLFFFYPLQPLRLETSSASFLKHWLLSVTFAFTPHSTPFGKITWSIGVSRKHMIFFSAYKYGCSKDFASRAFSIYFQSNGRLFVDSCSK